MWRRMLGGECGWNVSNRRSGVVSKSEQCCRRSRLHSKRSLRVVNRSQLIFPAWVVLIFRWNSSLAVLRQTVLRHPTVLYTTSKMYRYAVGVAQSCIIALEHATMRVNVHSMLQIDRAMAAIDREVRSTHATVEAAGRHDHTWSCMHASWAGDFFFFFFWIRGSTDLRRFERILGGSGSIRVSVDSFYP